MADLNALIAQGYQFQAPPDPFVQYGKMQQLENSATQNQLARQQMTESATLAPFKLAETKAKSSAAQLELKQAQEAQDFVNGIMQKVAENHGGINDPMEAAQQMLLNPNPKVQMIGKNLAEAHQLVEGIKQQRAYAQGEPSTGSFANFPNAREIAPGDGPIVSRMSAPVPLAPAAQGEEGTPVLTGNALAPTSVNAMQPNRLAQIDKRLAFLRPFSKVPEAVQERADLVKERDRLMTPHVVSGNLVSGAGDVLFTAPQNVTPTDTARLIAERDKFPLGSPNRALYDQQIANLGATAQNARDRLAFDQSKFNYERANPGKTIKEVTQADGSTQVFAIDNRTGMATQVMMAGALGAAPAGGGRGSVGVPGGQVGPGTPLVGAAKLGALTEAQGNAALFGSAMAQAQVTLDQVEKRGTKTGPVTTSLAQGIVKYVPLGVGDKLVGDVYALAMQDPTKLFGPDVDQQKLGQAQLAFSIAYLRKTSGAAFGPSELANTVNEYFPQIGEDASVTKQKSEARKRAIKGMKISAGKEGSKFIEEYESPGAAGGGTPSANDPLGIRGK